MKQIFRFLQKLFYTDAFILLINHKIYKIELLFFTTTFNCIASYLNHD